MPLMAIFFLHKSEKNCLTYLNDRREILACLLSCLIKSVRTADWWEEMFALVEVLIGEVPFYRMEFDLSGNILPILEKLVQQPAIVRKNTS